MRKGERMMAHFKLPKETVLMACEEFLADKDNYEKDKDGSYLYIDVIEIQRLYDLLKSNLYNHTQSVGLESFEAEMLSGYLGKDVK
jgi:hypothetical protein